MTNLPPRCCGRCKHLGFADGFDRCEWPLPKVPFWAHISNGEHGEYVELTDGTRCQTFEPKEPAHAADA